MGGELDGEIGRQRESFDQSGRFVCRAVIGDDQLELPLDTRLHLN